MMESFSNILRFISFSIEPQKVELNNQGWGNIDCNLIDIQKWQNILIAILENLHFFDQIIFKPFPYWQPTGNHRWPPVDHRWRHFRAANLVHRWKNFEKF